jgi:hypothetical protein
LPPQRVRLHRHQRRVPPLYVLSFEEKKLVFLFHTVRTVHQDKSCPFVSLCKASAPSWLSRRFRSAISILHFWRFVANPAHCLFAQRLLRRNVGQNRSSCRAVTGVGLLTAAPLIPTLTLRVQRGASRLIANSSSCPKALAPATTPADMTHWLFGCSTIVLMHWA